MTARIAPKKEAPPRRRAVSLAQWARAINTLAASTGNARRGNTKASRGRAKATQAGELILTSRDRVSPGAQHGTHGSATFGYRMAPEVAERLVAEGLDPDFLGEIAAISGLESRDVLDFAGIDRTTVSRRKASGSALLQGVAVKALQMTDLMTQATEVFGSPAQASTWLTKPHPSLEGDTPLRRARTPWGMSKVQSILVALRYGGAA